MNILAHEAFNEILISLNRNWLMMHERPISCDDKDTTWIKLYLEKIYNSNSLFFWWFIGKQFCERGW